MSEMQYGSTPCHVSSDDGQNKEAFCSSLYLPSAGMLLSNTGDGIPYSATHKQRKDDMISIFPQKYYTRFPLAFPTVFQVKTIAEQK